jgi:transcription initiation factor TFIIIB Brf1 subunit/transcription initiation factor TFIIB
MADFSLFEEALNYYNNENNVVEEEKDNSCLHNDITNDNGTVTCNECGEEISKLITHDKEWRYYSNSDGKKVADPNRVQMRKNEDRNIFKDVENLGFSEKIVSKANEIYHQVTNGQIYRGNSRKAIVFACIFHAYKINGNPQSHEHLLQLFGIKRRGALKGIKHVNINAPKNSDVHTAVITPITLVNDIMDKFKANNAQKNEVEELYGKVKNRSSKLNRARPQSVASGLVYYWIKLKNLDINVKEFAKKTDLSELTITKIAKEISQILKTPDVI